MTSPDPVAVALEACLACRLVARDLFPSGRSM